MKISDIGYLISQKWFRNWKDFVLFADILINNLKELLQAHLLIKLTELFLQRSYD